MKHRSARVLMPGAVLLLLAAMGPEGVAQTLPASIEPPAGVTRRAWTDSARQAWGRSDPRPLVTLIWYPAESGFPAETLTIGPSGRPQFLAGVMARGATLSTARRQYPLVLLSHGTGGSALQLAWLGTALARHGMIAAAVNHHGNTGAEPSYDARGFVLWWERARDLSAVLDRMLADSVFGSRIDRSRIGAAGFSLGGYTVLELAGARTDLRAFELYCASPGRDATCEAQPEMRTALDDFDRLRATDPAVQASLAHAGDSYRDPRISAIVALAPAVVQALAPTLPQIRVPLLVIVGDSDQIAPAATNGLAAAARVGGARLSLLPSVGHYSFLSCCTIHGKEQLADLCHDPDGTDRGRVHDTATAAVLRFLNGQWKQQ
jgi:predicted dienelactone hydrolase